MIIFILLYGAILAVFAFLVIAQAITFRTWKYTALAIHFFASVSLGFGFLPRYFNQSIVAGALYWIIIFLGPPAVVAVIADYIKKRKNR